MSDTTLVSVRPCGCYISVTPNKMNAEFCYDHKASDKQAEGLCKLVDTFALEHGSQNWYVVQFRERKEKKGGKGTSIKT